MTTRADRVATVKNHLLREYALGRLSNSEISRLSGVDPSQVSRICRGEFKTLSDSVVQICKALRIEVETISTDPALDDPAWLKIEASIRAIWDKTPEDAEKIARLIQTIGQLRA
ncbi:MAG: helix-turn-helix transcriptional regulator [Pseudomonadota bacterium]